MQLALLATLLASSHALAPVIQPRRHLTKLNSDMIKGSVVGEDGITAEVAPQDDDLADADMGCYGSCGLLHPKPAAAAET